MAGRGDSGNVEVWGVAAGVDGTGRGGRLGGKAVVEEGAAAATRCDSNSKL